EPRLRLDLVPDRLLQHAVFRTRSRRSHLYLGQPAHKVSAADHAEQLTVLHDRHLAYAMRIKQLGNLGEAGGLRDRNDEPRHDVTRLEAMALDVFPRSGVGIGEQVEPPFSL